LIAVAYAYYRRYIEKLPRLKRGLKAGMVYIFLTVLLLSELLSLGFEQVWLVNEFAGHSPVFTPVGSLIAFIFSWMPPAAGAVFFYIFWWVHLIALLSFLVYVPQSKHAHLIAGPINVFLQRLDAPSKLQPIDFEDESIEEYGKGKIEDFTHKQLLDLYACVECGRCTNMCPAAGTGKTLSPMQLIVKMRDHLTAKGAAVTSRSPWLPAAAWGKLAEQNAGAAQVAAGAENVKTFDYSIELIGDVITEEELWACTTCRNCEDQCPVTNEHVDKIIDMRRYLVMTRGEMPAESARTLQNIERQGNPWGLNRNDRENWRKQIEDVKVPTVKETDDFEYLFFVGSMGSYDNRSTKITEAFVRILDKAGVKFAILGNEERNSGDTPRRIGNEFLFQQLAMENIENFQKYGVKKIVTCDPHAYNIMKNEYPDFGLEGVEVYHSTELVAKLLAEGRIKPTKEVKERITFHDSCYLGRYNKIYDKPREILQAIPGVELVEMKRHGADSMCCGAGGGMMWVEETQGKRVNIARTEQALEVKPTLIGSACPYCLTMLSDGTKALEVENEVKTKDVIEILAEAI
jgi:Fe-S oxidoreductase